MGYLRDWDLSAFNCSVYVETGTGQGISLGKAYSSFERCYSVDMDQEMVEAARRLYPEANFLIEKSIHALEQWLGSGEIKQTEQVLFYLDAHFPGADFKGAAYDVHAPDAVPLQNELEIIKKYRPHSHDVIICDDARIYMIGPFEGGNVEWLQVPNGLNFIREIFDISSVYINFSEEGYIIIDRKGHFQKTHMTHS